MQRDPERFEGHKPPAPMEVCNVLIRYLANAMESEEPRGISKNNKRFILALGDACDELLQYLGYHSNVILDLSLTLRSH